jgi:hypothetical protein
MRRILVTLLLLSFVCSSAVFPKDKSNERVKPLPLFMDQDFSFSQVGTICVAPALDLRSGKTEQVFLSGKGAREGFSHLPSADQAVANHFKILGYQTTGCGPVNATAADLNTPSATWLHSLNFGTTQWLFVLGVDDVQAKTLGWLVGSLNGYAGGHAVVSGYLFAKRGDEVKLVWRDRAFGMPWSSLDGRTSSVKDAISDEAVTSAIMHLIWKFDRRSNKRPLLEFAVNEQTFVANCDVVWTALKDALNSDSKKYRVAFLDASDRMALYTVYHKNLMNGPFENEDHTVLKTQGDTCAVQVTQSYNQQHGDDWSDLIKEVRASISK